MVNSEKNQEYEDDLNGENKTEDTEKSSEESYDTEKDKEVIKTVLELYDESKNYRDSFTSDWQNVEEQINCIPPKEWEDKEDWQTKVYIPSQFKISETSAAIMMELLFGQRDFFAVIGIDNDKDRQKETELKRFMTVLFEKGGFFKQNGYVMQEGCDTGTSFIKLLVDPKTGIKYIWKSATDSFLDPMAITDFADSRYFIEEYNEEIYSIMKNPLYDKDKVDKLLLYLDGKTDKSKKSDLISINDTEGDTEYQISKTYKSVSIKEFWGFLPVKKTKTIEKDGVNNEVEYYDYDMRAITIADDNCILRNDKSDYINIPYNRLIVKRKKKHAYGNGFCKNLTGLQDLINSIVNLGFDKTKLKSIGVVVKDESMVADPSSIQIKPMAQWSMKAGGMDSVRLEYLGEDGTRDVITSVMFIDEMIQDASGITRHYQSADAPQGGEETLGQTKIKMMAAERRFLKVAKEIAEDYVIPTLKNTFKIITNPAFVDFFQEMFNRTIGMKPVDNPQNAEIVKQSVLNGTQPQILPPTFEPKLVLKDLGEVDLDFKFTGLTNYQQKTQVPEQMNQILKIARDDPALGMFIKKDKAIKRWMETSDVADVSELMVDDEDSKSIQSTIMKNFQTPNMGGNPAQNNQPGMNGQIPGQIPGQPPTDINPEKIKLQLESIMNKGG